MHIILFSKLETATAFFLNQVYRQEMVQAVKDLKWHISAIL